MQLRVSLSWNLLLFTSYWLFLRRFLGLVDENVRSTWPWHRTTNQQQVLVGIYLNDLQVLGGHTLVAEVTRKMLVLPNTRRKRTAADSARRAMEHRTVRRIPACVVPALHAAREAAAFADARHVDQFASFEAVHKHAIANLGLVLRLRQADFPQNFHGSYVGLLEVPRECLVNALRLHEFHQAQLRGF